MPVLSSVAGESPDAALLLLPMSQMCCSPTGIAQGELSPGGERELEESVAVCPSLVMTSFLGHFILSLYPWHWIRKPGAGQLAGRQIKPSLSRTLLCATWFGRMPLLLSLVGKGV